VSLLVDIHLHSQDLIPYPFRVVYNLSQIRTKPKTFKLKNMRKVGLNLAVVNAVGDKLITRLYMVGSFQAIKKQIEKIRNHAKRMNAIIYEDFSSVKQALEEHRPIILLGIEGGDFINEKLSRLKDIHKIGVRMLTLVHFTNNCIGSISTKFSDLTKGKTFLNNMNETGLTKFGKETIEELNSLGIIIDLAHANNKTSLEAIELSTQPVVISHSGALALQPKFTRYVSDEVIQALSKERGILGIWPFYYSNLGTETIKDFVNHAKYVKSLIGGDILSIGTDINGLPGIMKNFDYLRDFSTLPTIFQKNGFTKEETEGICGKNFLNLLKNY